MIYFGLSFVSIFTVCCLTRACAIISTRWDVMVGKSFFFLLNRLANRKKNLWISALHDSKRFIRNYFFYQSIFKIKLYKHGKKKIPTISAQFGLCKRVQRHSYFRLNEKKVAIFNKKILFSAKTCTIRPK